MADRIHRVTMFKMPKEEDRQRMLEQYRKMGKDNQKARSAHSPGWVDKIC